MMDFHKKIIPPKKNQGLRQDGYFIWCGSVIADEKGCYHMFASRWSKEKTFSGWVTVSKIVRAVSDKPEGPFEIVEELDVLNQQDWSAKMTHNPTVTKYKDKYYLFYIGTTYADHVPDVPFEVKNHPARFNQRIGVAYASSPEGPWTPSAANPILKPRKDEWDSTFVSNPSVCIVDDNEVRLVYKAKWHADDRLILGLAVANDPEGPYERQGPSPLFSHDVEDPFIWKDGDMFWMIAKDMSGKLVGKYNGILFQSKDGYDWELSEHPLAWDHQVVWDDGTVEDIPLVERPQLLIVDGKPICFYTAVGDGINNTYNLARRLRW